MSTLDSSPPLNTYAADWGGVLTSTFLASIIYGITVLQSFYYYNTYPYDRVAWKTLVFVIMALDTAALGLFMYCMQYYLVLSWGIPEMLLPDVKPFPTEYVITSILVAIVQCFYINTIRALRAPLTVTIVLLMLCLVSLGSGLILPAVQLKLKLIPVIVVDPLNHLAFNIARGAALACDLGIVAALCWLLGKRKTEVSRANNMINALIAFSVERGVFQAIVQAGEVLAYAIRPKGIYFLPFHVIVSRIYCTSLLATLNTREYVAKRGIPTIDRETRITFAENDKHSSNLTSSGPVMSSAFDPPFLFTNPASQSRSGQGRDLEDRRTSANVVASRTSTGGALRLDLGSNAMSSVSRDRDRDRKMYEGLAFMPEFPPLGQGAGLESQEHTPVTPTKGIHLGKGRNSVGSKQSGNGSGEQYEMRNMGDA